MVQIALFWENGLLKVAPFHEGPFLFPRAAGDRRKLRVRHHRDETKIVDF